MRRFRWWRRITERILGLRVVRRCVAAKEVISNQASGIRDQGSVSEKRKDNAESQRTVSFAEKRTTGTKNPPSRTEGGAPYASLYFRCKSLSVSLSSFAAATN